MYLQTAKNYWFLPNKNFSKYYLQTAKKIIDFYWIKISQSMYLQAAKKIIDFYRIKISPSMYLQTAKKL